MRVVIQKSKVKNKKYTAIFYDGDKKIKTSQFGDNRYEDYTQHKDKERRSRYRNRHKKDLNTGDYMRPGFLSYYILWGDSSSLKTNISNYKKKFNLK
tara:strand:- start:1689 stop:1979 length:291 start_codon:yes stop_codon:yes gene_type:complete